MLVIRIRLFMGLLDPDRDPLVRGTDPAPAPDPYLFLINVLSGLKLCLQNEILTQNFSTKLNFLDRK